MNTKTLCRQLRQADEALLFLLFLLASVLLSYWASRIQRDGLCRVIRGAPPQSVPDVFPIRMGASALVVGSLGFFLCLAVQSAREGGDGAARRSACTNLQASLLVFVAALLRLDDLMQNAPRPAQPDAGR